jgi:hypothetical protein
MDSLRMTRGSFSYLNDNISCLELDANTILCIERINNNVAKIYLADQNRVVISLTHANVKLFDASGNAIAPYRDMFLITWVDSYRLFWNAQEILTLNNQRQQTIYTSAASKDMKFYTKFPFENSDTTT